MPGIIGWGNGPRCSASLAGSLPLIHLPHHRSSYIIGAVGFRPLGFCYRLIDLGAVAPFVRRQRHHSVMDRGINTQRAIDRLIRLFPRDRKRLCCRWPRGLDPRRSSHFAPRFLICLKIRIAGSPSRTIFARLRSLAGNIIALTTAERSFIVP